MIRSAASVPREHPDSAEHRRILATAVRQLAAEKPVIGEVLITETAITTTAWTTLGGFPATVGSELPRRLQLSGALDVQRETSDDEPVDFRISVDGVAVRSWTHRSPAALLLSPAAAVVEIAAVPVSIPLQTVAAGSHTLEIEARTSGSGAWRILDTSFAVYMLHPE